MIQRITSIFLLVFAAGALALEDIPRGILPDVATPLAYRLDLTVVPERERFSGHVEIDVQLKRRYDLIPNLVETVKGYAKHEREVLDRVVSLRNQAMQNHGSAASHAKDENALLVGLRSVFVVAEGYPQLKSDANFLALQQELVQYLSNKREGLSGR